MSDKHLSDFKLQLEVLDIYDVCALYLTNAFDILGVRGALGEGDLNSWSHCVSMRNLTQKDL